MEVNRKNEFVLRTRKIDTYFRGRIVFTHDSWEVVCASCSGGSVPVLDIIDYRAKTKKLILEKIQKFKTKYNLISTDK